MHVMSGQQDLKTIAAKVVEMNHEGMIISGAFLMATQGYLRRNAGIPDPFANDVPGCKSFCVCICGSQRFTGDDFCMP